ncbi:hypothetical protein BKA59DRAFT_475826 [Fusarium tricinctum]|uniref:Uncharacterized protein n=1 Tax=Fusarium tricinctum TaxID=61284 RepID=A0A8K0WAU1_9HYPO|nr:hypothetical protein BKA59DRAFT_475826 [Fusarium tricinctum]
MKLTVLASTAVLIGPAFSRLHKRDECATRCTDAYNVCTAKPDASQAFCATEFSNCVGFNVFLGRNSVPALTACSAGATGLSAIGASMASTGLSTTSAAAASTSTAAEEVSTATAAVTADTVETTAMATILSSATDTIPETYDCVTECNDNYNICRTAPNANMASCAAQYAQCLGYNPFGGNGSLVTPTACSDAGLSTTQSTQPVTTSEPATMVSSTASVSSQQEISILPVTSLEQPIATCADMCMGGTTTTEGEAPPVATGTPVVVVDGAGNIRPFMAFAALVALAAV